MRLGEASYSLYILHIPLLMVSRSVAGHVLGREVLDTPGFLVLAVTTSLASHRLVEQPLNHHLRRAFDSLRTREPSTSTTRSIP